MLCRSLLGPDMASDGHTVNINAGELFVESNDDEGVRVFL